MLKGKYVPVKDFMPQYAAEVICIKCRKRWIAIYPKGTWLKDLECENCGPGYVIKTGQPLPDKTE
jgi:hypothetical protein